MKSNLELVQEIQEALWALDAMKKNLGGKLSDAQAAPLAEVVVPAQAPTDSAALVKGNGAGAPSEDAMVNLLFYGDIASLTQTQRAQYLFHLAKKLGLDPASKPFDIIPVGGGSKLMVYANKGAAAQLQKVRGLNVTKVYAGPLRFGQTVMNELPVPNYVLDIYEVEVSIKGPDGRESFNVGTVSIKGLMGDTLSNKIMACNTKAMRRAVLIHEGLGFTDESELDTIPGVMKELNPQKFYENTALVPFPGSAPLNSPNQGYKEAMAKEWTTPVAIDAAQEILTPATPPVKFGKKLPPTGYILQNKELPASLSEFIKEAGATGKPPLPDSVKVVYKKKKEIK